MEASSRLRRGRRSPAHMARVAVAYPWRSLLVAVALLPPAGLLAFLTMTGFWSSLGLGTDAPPLLVALVALVFAAGGARRIAARVDHPGFQRALENMVLRDLKFREKLREAGIQPWLRKRINAERGLSYGTELYYRSSSGLAEVDDPAHEIPTGTREGLLKLMREGMPGGAIGLSGPRGVGKSTLMRSICGRGTRWEGDVKVLGVVVDAPVEYDARDFVLHLFARVCSEVLGQERVRALRGWNRPFGGSPLEARTLAESLLRLSIGPLLALVGLLLVLPIDVGVSARVGWGIGLLLAGCALTGMLLIHELPRLGRRRGALRTSVERARDPATVALARDRLGQIWFQQSFSSGWSGSFRTPVGLEGGVSATNELAERQMSFPDIVALLREFLERVAAENGQVRIGIDELDKMDDEAARRFLNEIKVVFRVPRCFFLISISEDAMSFFERRGLPFRDVFDSSFDAVMRVPQLEFRVSRELLERRTVGLPIPFACFLHCLSGGLPRDLIRAARDLVALAEGTSLDAATAKLLGDALEAKADAAKVASRRFESEAHVALLVAWLEELRACGSDAEALLALCRGFHEDLLAKVRALPDEEDLRRERRELQGLATQLLAFAYLAATMTRFFARFGDREFAAMAAGTEPGEGEETAGEAEGPSLVDRLAGVSQAFSADVSTVWTTLSDLRVELGLEPVEFPLTRFAEVYGTAEPAAAG